MTTLLQLRTKVREFIDESSAVRWTDATLNSFINSSIAQVTTELATDGNNQFHKTVDLTASAGTLDISSLNVLKIVNLSQVFSGSTGVYQQVYPARPKDIFLANTSITGSFRLTYVSKPVLPSADSDTISYGNTVTTSDVLDEYVAVLAARKALIKDNEVRPGLEALKMELEKQVKTYPNSPGWFVLPAPQWPAINRSIYNYALPNLDTITLMIRA